MTDREKIAREIGKSRDPLANWDDWSSTSRAVFRREADVILMSSWLARRDAEVAAKALEDAGWEYAVKDYRAPGYMLLGDTPLSDEERVSYYGTRPLIRRRKAGPWEEIAESARASSLGAENPETNGDDRG